MYGKLLQINVKLHTVNCVLSTACEADFTGGLLWPTSRRDRLVTQRCSELHPSFRSGVMISRQCGSNGNWLPVSVQDCTMFDNSNPLVIVYFAVNTSSNSEVDLMPTAENVSMYGLAINIAIV